MQFFTNPFDWCDAFGMGRIIVSWFRLSPFGVSGGFQQLLVLDLI